MSPPTSLYSSSAYALGKPPPFNLSLKQSGGQSTDALARRSSTIEDDDSVSQIHTADGVQIPNAAIKDPTIYRPTNNYHGHNEMSLAMGLERAPMEPPTPQPMPLSSTRLPFLRLRPLSPVTQFHEPLPPSLSDHSAKRVSFQQILEFGMVVPASPETLTALAYTRHQWFIDAAQRHEKSLQHRERELEMAAKTNGRFARRRRRQQVNGLLPTENRIVDEHSKCTYCNEQTLIPMRHFFMHVLTEMCHSAGFPKCASGRGCILSTREKLIEAFEFWARPTFRCPHCYMECGSSDLVVQHLEYGCRLLFGDLSHISNWYMQRRPFDEELAELFASLGFAGFS